MDRETWEATRNGKIYNRKWFDNVRFFGGLAIATTEELVPYFNGAEYIKGSILVGGLALSYTGIRNRWKDYWHQTDKLAP